MDTKLLSLVCDPSYLARLSACYCFQSRQHQAVQIYALWIWANALIAPTPPVPTGVILPDGAGGFWLLVISSNGNIGMTTDPGPATPDVILADGSGGFWKLIVNPSGLRGTQSDPGPATAAPTAGGWTLVVDTSGELGATS